MFKDPLLHYDVLRSDGSLLFCCRSIQPKFQFIVLNRRNKDNYVENLLEDFEYEVQGPFLFYHHRSQGVDGMWFYDELVCKEVATCFDSILKLNQKSKTSSSKSELEEVEAGPTMVVMDGPLEPSSVTEKDMSGYPSKELLNDLCSRFVLNSPKEDRCSFVRILFMVEFAYWFYEDNFVVDDPMLKTLNMKDFTNRLFNSCDVLRPYVTHIDCLLVKGWEESSWGFPRGKKCKGEEDHTCAIRVVLEETGFDVSKLLKKEVYIEFIFKIARTRLYIVAGVTDDTVFAPLTKKEISEIAWYPLDHLEPAGGEVTFHQVGSLKLNMVAPFLSTLKSWISKHPSPVAIRPDKRCKASSVWKADTSTGGENGTATMETDHPQDTVICQKSFRRWNLGGFHRS